MTIYQVYYWNGEFGPNVSFYGTKKEALTFAKETARGGSAQIGSSVEVSRVQLPSKKAKLLFYLNCVEAQVIMPTSENIAEFEAIGDEGGE
tara:strand:+ start:28 stop:300 length:273 start_codon:yes stop_codon:yes gene_type:complete